ncbi:MAG: hypothetical protein GY879_12595 [Planctomycetes bacterium]|nr:hypothetical protein [Planctomycetota bacterium]
MFAMKRFAFVISCALIHFSAATAAQVGGEEILHHQFLGGGGFNVQLGFVVDKAGDVNGDGFADILIGCKYEDVGGLSDVGVAFVFSGADGSQLYRFEGANRSDYLGSSLAGGR